MPSLVNRIFAYADRAYKSLAQAMAKRAGVLPSGWVERNATTTTSDGRTEVQPTDVNIMEEYRRSLWVYACVSKKARYAGGMPFLLKRVRRGTDEIVNDHPALDVLWKPAPKRTWARLVRIMVINYELAGRAFLEKAADEGDDVDSSKPLEGPAKQLWPLLPHKMKLVADPREGVTEYVYSPNLKPQVFAPSRIVYWNDDDPVNPDDGVGAMRPAWISNLLDRNAREWNKGFFERGAHPDVILKPMPGKQIRTADRERIEKDFEQRLLGTQKGRRPYVMPENVEYQESGLTHREIQFDRLLKLSRSELMAAFKVPPVLLGLLEDAAYATAWIQLAVFRDYEMVPLMDDLFATLSNGFLLDFDDGEDLYLEVDREAMLSQEERTGLYGIANGSIQTGLLSLDEARELVGKAPKVKTDDTGSGEAAQSTHAPELEPPPARAPIDELPGGRDEPMLRAAGTNGIHRHRRPHPADSLIEVRAEA